MNRIFTLCGSLILALSLNGCSTNCGTDPVPCQPQQLPTSTLEAEYGCADTRFLNSGPTESAIIIRTQAEFDQRVSGACHPQIDFAKYDLVIGRRQMSGAASSSATYVYQLDCPNNERVLRVVLKSGVTNDAGFRSYHALVPKLAPAETVKVRVEIVN